MPRNFEPDLGNRAAPRLAPPEVSFKPGRHCDHDVVTIVNIHDGSLAGSRIEPGSIGTGV